MFEGEDYRLIRRLKFNNTIYFCQRVVKYSNHISRRKIYYEVREQTGWFTSKLLFTSNDEIDAVNYLDDLIKIS